MARQGYDGLSALAALQAMLDASSRIEVIHEGGHRWQAQCLFPPPASEAEIEKMKRQLTVPLSPTYELFLRQHNGALLFASEDGQWGFKLYGTNEILTANEEAKTLYDDWPTSYLIFAESLGDPDVLVLNTAQPVEEGIDYRVIDGNSDDPVWNWKPAACSFGDWLDRLVVAQGAKYWRWS